MRMGTRGRRLLGGAVLGALAVSALTTTANADDGKDQKAKNVIFLLGDGMGVTHVDAARIRYYGAHGQLNMEQMPVLGKVQTYAVEPNSNKPNYVTDSASAGTAWSSGVKTYNAALGKDAYGHVVPTIMEQAKAAGMRTGNVSTAEITDATPAAMFSHVSQRACQGPKVDAVCGDDVPVAEQIARNNVADVIFGGGLSRFEPDDAAAMQADGYTILGSFGQPGVDRQTADTQQVATRASMNAVSGENKRVIGLFNRGNMTIEKYKREHSQSFEADEPSVAEMTTKAIQLLTRSDQGRKNGFFLQVEGALIDKRSHANDASQTLEETKAFDEAVKVALDFAKKDKNTLVLVTADHECAGFNIIEKGTFTNAEAANPPLNTDSGNPANNSTPERTSGNTKDAKRSSGIFNAPGSADKANFGPATFRTPDDPAGVQDGTAEASLWLTYLSGNHTGADVNIYGYGPGSDQFFGRNNNTDLYAKMVNALRLNVKTSRSGR